jgi:DNA-binding transcriptional MerR regulator
MDKAPDAFRTISEVAEELDLPQHVLRFWESRFHDIRPMKRGGGRRYYRAEDVALLRGIRHLLYGEGYTVRGVQRLLREQGIHFVQKLGRGAASKPPHPPDPAHAGKFEPSISEEDAPSRVVEEPDEDRLPPAATADIRPGSAPDQMQKLRDALHELTECRRLLDSMIRER